jgi:hypothetical protein
LCPFPPPFGRVMVSSVAHWLRFGKRLLRLASLKECNFTPLI